MSQPQFRRIINTLRHRWHIPDYGESVSERYWPSFSRLDDAGQRAITRFDRERQMQPGSFRLNLKPSSM
jgi:hypothetical protein